MKIESPYEDYQLIPVSEIDRVCREARKRGKNAVWTPEGWEFMTEAELSLALRSRP